MISTAIQQLVNYGLDTGLILPDDEIYIRNQLLMTMQLDSFTEPEGDVCYADLESILKTLVDPAPASSAPTSKSGTKPTALRPPPTGSTSSARTPITSAATASSGTSSG